MWLIFETKIGITFKVFLILKSNNKNHDFHFNFPSKEQDTTSSSSEIQLTSTEIPKDIVALFRECDFVHCMPDTVGF